MISPTPLAAGSTSRNVPKGSAMGPVAAAILAVIARLGHGVVVIVTKLCVIRVAPRTIWRRE